MGAVLTGVVGFLSLKLYVVCFCGDVAGSVAGTGAGTESGTLWGRC